MKNLGLLLSAIVTIILVYLYIPPVVIYIIGCYQIGYWIGDFLYNRWE